MRVQDAGIAAGAFGQKCRQPHFTEQVQAIVPAGGAIGAETDVDAAFEHGCYGRDTAAEFEIGAWAMSNRSAFGGEECNFACVEVNPACTAIRLGVMSPSRRRRSSGRTPWMRRLSSISAVVSCR